MSVSRIEVTDEAAMIALGEDLARVLRPGDRVGLEGDLGAGKTALARAILRSLAGDPALEVPSPTFTLVQEYALRLTVRHIDLYRVEGDEALAELGLGADPEAVELIEWPRAVLPVMLRIDFSPSEEGRIVTIAAPEAWRAALDRQRTLSAFVASAGWGDAQRVPLVQDASTRNYERLSRGRQTAILMDAPPFTPPEGSYPRRAGLAHGNLDAFLCVGTTLARRGLSVPQVYATERAIGALLLEDFGQEPVACDGKADAERYRMAVDVLAALHRDSVPAVLDGPPAHQPPRFDTDLGTVEVALFCEWYAHLPQSEDFIRRWRAVLDQLWRDDDTLALRDYHSPNLFWLPERHGIARIGVIDYQDAMIAPSAYDVVSLVEDARVDVPAELQAELVERYLAARPELDHGRWLATYRVLGAQRATKILGLFRRLNDRDGKPQYLKHLPRLERALAKNLAAEPALQRIAEWTARHTRLMDLAA